MAETTVVWGDHGSPLAKPAAVIVATGEVGSNVRPCVVVVNEEAVRKDVERGLYCSSWALGLQTVDPHRVHEVLYNLVGVWAGIFLQGEYHLLEVEGSGFVIPYFVDVVPDQVGVHRSEAFNGKEE